MSYITVCQEQLVQNITYQAGTFLEKCLFLAHWLLAIGFWLLTDDCPWFSLSVCSNSIWSQYCSSFSSRSHFSSHWSMKWPTPPQASSHGTSLHLLCDPYSSLAWEGANCWMLQSGIHHSLPWSEYSGCVVACMGHRGWALACWSSEQLCKFSCRTSMHPAFHKQQSKLKN